MYEQQSSNLIALLMFIPQWTVVIAAGVLYHHDVLFAMVVQTWAFVSFNKVYTAQYFLWYMSLFPFVAINNRTVHKSWYVGRLIYAAQSLFMPLWEMTAFKLEFLGENAFYQIQYANYAFFVVNIASLVLVLRGHQMTVTFDMEGEYTVKKMMEAIQKQQNGRAEDAKKIGRKQKE